jgi:hypothetical protein
LTKSHASISQEENDTINKYIHQIDLLTPEFINNLPPQDRNILNKILEQETKTFPKEIPFTVVQHKNNQKQPETEIIFEKTSNESCDINMNESTDKDYLKDATTTPPPKDRHIKPYFPFDPDYTFGRQMIQTDENINTPLLQDTSTRINTTQSLHPNGGRKPTTFGRGSGRGGRFGGINSRPASTIHTTNTTKSFTINGSSDNINTLNNINQNSSINNSISNNESTSNINTDTTSSTTYNSNQNNINTNNINNTTIEMSIHNDTDSDSEVTLTLQSTRNQNSVKFQPIKKVPLEHEHIFCVYINAKKAHTNDEMTREAIAEHVLQSLQQADPSIKILSVPNLYYQRLSTSSMYQQEQETKTPTKQYIRYISDLLINHKGAMTGNLWFNSPSIYSLIKRNTEYRKHIVTKYNIYTTSNRLNAPHITEIGYFLHRLVRHDTVEDINYTRSFLPEN